MAVPKPVQLPSGTWRIQLQLGGERISLTGPDKKALVREAEYLKAEYKAGKRAAPPEPASPSPTVSECFDRYIATREHSLSPATIRFYNGVKRQNFPSVMQRSVADIATDEWQGIVDAELATKAVKTVDNAYSAVKTVLADVCKVSLPAVKLPVPVPNPRAFLQPTEVKPFIAAAKDSPYAVPLLLALSSMRISEISALDWATIPKKTDFIRVRGATVYDKDNKPQTKAQNKNVTSTRSVPVLIPELRAALERDRKPSGSVIPGSQNALRHACHRVCAAAGVTDVTIHGLRHSFASLCYHLRVPEKIVMEMGGWADLGTVQRIYTHIARSDFDHYKTALAAFYNPPTGEK